MTVFRSQESSFKRNTAVLLAIVLLTIWAGVGYNVNKTYNDKLEASIIVAQNMVRSLTAHTGASFELVRFKLNQVADMMDRIGPQPILSEEITASLGHHVEDLPPLLSLVIVDSEGNIVQAAISDDEGGYLQIKSINVADRAYYRVFASASELNPKSIFIGRPIEGRINGVWFIPVSRPRFNSDGSFAGVVLGTIKLETFGNLYGSFDLPANASVALVKKDGVFLVRIPFNKMFYDQTFEDNPFFKEVVPAAPSGVYFERASIDGQERIITYQSLEAFPLVLVMTQTTTAVMADWVHDASLVIILGVFSTLILGYFAWSLWQQASTIIKQRDSLEETVAERTRELSDSNLKLKQQAFIDGLTGAANRRHLEERLQLEFRRAQRNKKPISVAMIDVDYFKKFNDTYGHLMGDDCLKRIVGVLQENAKRPTDMVARYGGEEFCCLLPETADTAADQLAETFRQEIESASIGKLVTGEEVNVTVSIGVATVVPDQDNTVLQLIGEADKALYRAKNDGRNLVRHAE